jgi:hypothetical protein
MERVGIGICNLTITPLTRAVEGFAAAERELRLM